MNTVHLLEQFKFHWFVGTTKIRYAFAGMTNRILALVQFNVTDIVFQINNFS